MLKIKSLALIKAIEKKTQQGTIHAIRCAISSTLSLCIAAGIQHYWQLPAKLSFILILTAAVSNYFRCGKHWYTQAIMIMLGIVATACCSLITVLLNLHIYPLLFFFATISFVAYYLSGINSGAMFISKFGIALVSFSMDQLPRTDFSYALQTFLVVISGGIITVLVNLLLYSLTPKFDLKRISHLWFDELHQLLNHIQKNKRFSYLYFRELNHLFKTQLATQHFELSLRVDRAGMALIKLILHMNENPSIRQQFHPQLAGLFQTAIHAVASRQTEPLLEEYRQFREKILELRQQHFFSSMKRNLRSQYIELLFLLEKFIHDICTLINNYPDQISAHNDDSSFAQWLRRLKLQIVEMQQIRFNDSMKIALRAAIILPVTVLVAHFSHAQHIPWMIMSSNMVLLVRQGDTLKRGFDRIMGHFIGYFIAIFLGLYLWPYWNTAFIWLPILTFTTAYFFLRNYFLYSAFLMIMLLYGYIIYDPTHITPLSSLAYISWRLYDVTVGSVLGTLGGLSIFPNVGLKPISRMTSKILHDTANYLELLKINPDHPITTFKIMQNQQHLFQQLESMQQILGSLKFEPKRFIHNWQMTKQLVLDIESLLELVASLTRRVTAYPDYLIEHPTLLQLINQTIKNLQQQLIIDAKKIEKFDHRLVAIKKNQAPKTESLSSLQQLIKKDLAQEKDIIFNLADQENIGYDELLSSMGAMLLLEKINHHLQKINEHENRFLLHTGFRRSKF